MPIQRAMNIKGEFILFNGPLDEPMHLGAPAFDADEHDRQIELDRIEKLKEQEIALAVTVNPVIVAGVPEFVYGCSLCEGFNTKDPQEAQLHYQAHIMGMTGTAQGVAVMTNLQVNAAAKQQAKQMEAMLQAQEMEASKKPKPEVKHKEYDASETGDFKRNG